MGCTCGRYLSYTTALSVISQYTTVFSCHGTTLSCSVVPLLPRCHSSARLSHISPVAIAAGGYGHIFPMAHQKVAIVMPMHHGIRNINVQVSQLDTVR